MQITGTFYFDPDRSYILLLVNNILFKKNQNV